MDRQANSEECVGSEVGGIVPVASEQALPIEVGGCIHHLEDRDSSAVTSAFEFEVQPEQIPAVVAQLKEKGADASWAVFLFDTAVPSDDTDDQTLNLQYSIENGVVGFDWVMLGKRNAADKMRVVRLAKSMGLSVSEKVFNGVRFLRVEDGDICALGQAIIREIYQVADGANIGLLVDGFPYAPSNKISRETADLSVAHESVSAPAVPDQLETLPATGKRRLSVAWPEFARKLARVLARIDEDQYLILCVKNTKHFVQFAGLGSFGLRMETTSNAYLDKAQQLEERQIASLMDAGWKEPTASPQESTPENDPDGSPNFYMEFQVPVEFQTVSNMAISTLINILRVPHPGFLEYEAFDAEHNVLDLPALGLKTTTTPESFEPDLPGILTAALEEVTGLTDLAFDEDGDIAIRCGSALVYTRLILDPLRIHLHTPILLDTEESFNLLQRVNELNLGGGLMHYGFRGGVIVGMADVYALPFNASQVADAFTRCAAEADAIGKLLQGEFGGETAFPESVPSLM